MPINDWVKQTKLEAKVRERTEKENAEILAGILIILARLNAEK